MKKLILIMVLALLANACKTEKPNFVIEGKIDGLRKGKIYLQKWNDSILLNVDSISIYNENTFRFEQKLDYPQVMYLQLDIDTLRTNDNYIAFFADKGNLTVDAELNTFMYAEISADYPNQEAFNDYNQTMRRFGTQKLDLIKNELEARKNNNQIKLDSVNKAYNSMNRRRYLYAVNFAMAHPELELSPYIALEQSEYITPKFLDSIYSNLDQKVKQSFYGKKLKDLIN